MDLILIHYVFIFSYLSERKKRTKINDSYRSFADIAFELPQGAILDPLLFNIKICEMFFEKYECDIASYADDNTPYACDSDL